MSDDLRGSIKREDGYAVIRVPMSQVHDFRVALQPCPCKASKSTTTESIRERLDKGLGRLEAGALQR